ncbi:MAG: hypothetical protein JWQ29_2065 [Phenylobacterium sp.]|nr:hypothetical protein [Phenylobacterium sp.]
MRLMPMIVLAALSVGSAALAQGGGGLSPEVHAARDAVRQACAADATRLCEGKAGREVMMCMRDNADKLSGPCKEALAKMPPRQPRAGQ